MFPYRVPLKLVPLPSSIRSGVEGAALVGRGALSAERKTGKETSLGDNEKEPDASWESRGDML